MANLSPPPTDNKNHCGFNLDCNPGFKCFLYQGGTQCQPFSPPYPYPAVNATGEPPGWYFALAYPTVRYTGALVNQTLGANCTTIPVPQPSSDSNKLLLSIIYQYDLGKMISKLDRAFPNTFVSYRGNCDQGFYCSPTVPPPATNDGTFIGQLPGTCQALKAQNEVCQSSTQCLGWHINSDHKYYNDQSRCVSSDEASPTGVCKNIEAGSGMLEPDRTGFFQTTTRTYLLTALLFFFLVLLYIWYRRQKRRQQQMHYLDTPYDNTNSYLRNEGVHRAQAGPDDGELPSYGQHRRDTRLVGPTPEEISMYTYPNQPSQPHPNAAGQPYYSAPPSNFGHNPGYSQPLYAPPPNPPPMTPQEAEAAALTAAAAAALAPQPTTTAAQNSLPSYESNDTNSSTILESGGPPREKEEFEPSTEVPATDVKPHKQDKNQDKNQDNDSTSNSSGSGSGPGSSSSSPFNG